MKKSTGGLIRFIFQLIIAIFQIIVVVGLVYPSMMDMLETYQLYLMVMPPLAGTYLLYFIGLLGLFLMGIMHAIWRIIDNLVAWRTADKN